MKAKKGAFANSATGYGKRYNSSAPKTANRSTKSGEENSTKKSKGKENINKSKEKDKTKVEDQDTELNSGFGNYLRSDEGVEMMKMFVFANTVMLIITMAWPHFKEQYHWLLEWWHTTFQQEA
ncbi:hypothetical protein DOY81_001132 [Sarcophaga bullata]|nr:hypothetical protein DOY81_001132 [Sarcophaga bullata]